MALVVWVGPDCILIVPVMLVGLAWLFSRRFLDAAATEETAEAKVLGIVCLLAAAYMSHFFYLSGSWRVGVLC